MGPDQGLGGINKMIFECPICGELYNQSQASAYIQHISNFHSVAVGNYYMTFIADLYTKILEISIKVDKINERIQATTQD